ncbi:MAG: multiple sugar transport system permease protein [Candidatus Atribacteria bacterium]|uniref:carbohydrate ABC transporter permease n=1 Tax=Atrimonas thermophila TaxID=3064161 RepID=UPI0024AC5E70|nr:multiple sugar transport system permease protein [Candidatus Atribacteria bacterium]MDI3530483.1 multiple sugar transport system permease protein [Candidatus Atribacteria bacterium]
MRMLKQVAKKKNIAFWLFLPAFALTVGILVPFGYSVAMSFTNLNLTAGTKAFIGLGNYIKMAKDPEFWNSLKVTIFFTIGAVAFEVLVGFAAAYLLNLGLMGQRIYRTLFLVPVMLPPTVAAIMWKLMMAPIQGVLNYLLQLAGFLGLEWLGSSKTALMSVILIDAYVFIPFCGMIFLAGVQNLPKEPYEAAAVDGVSSWFVFRKLTLPLLKPVILIVLLFRIMDCLKHFDIIYAATKGGPASATMTLTVQAYYHSFRWTDMGYAFAHLVVLWAIVYVLSYFIVEQWKKAVAEVHGR